MSFPSQPDTGVIDHDRLHSLAKSFRPKLIIAGTSAYSRQLDYARFKKVVFLGISDRGSVVLCCVGRSVMTLELC